MCHIKLLYGSCQCLWTWFQGLVTLRQTFGKKRRRQNISNKTLTKYITLPMCSWTEKKRKTKCPCTKQRPMSLICVLWPIKHPHWTLPYLYEKKKDLSLHVTCDTWHMTHGVGWTFSQHFSYLAQTVWDSWCCEYFKEKDELMNQLTNYKAVCRTAPATPGLLKQACCAGCRRRPFPMQLHQ